MKKPKAPILQTTASNTSVSKVNNSIATLDSLLTFVKKNWLYFAILTAMIVVVYVNAIANGFVSDDRGLISEGEKILSFDFIFNRAAGPLGFLRALVWAIAYAVGGLNPIVFRLFNLIFHLGSTLLIFILVALLVRKRVAFFAASLFASHPILSESVVWVSGGGYPQYSFFFLLSFIFYILFSRSSKQNYYYFAIGFFALSLLSFSRAMTLAPVFLLYEYCFGNLRKNWKWSLPFLGLSAFWALFSLFQVGGRASEVVKSGNVANFVYNPFFQVPFSISTYLELIAWPQKLTFFHSDIEIPQGEMVVRWFVLLGFLGGIIYGFFKNKQIFFWSLFFILALFLYLIPVEIAWVVAERYVYLGSIGIFVLIGMLFYYLGRLKNAKKVVMVVFLVLLTAYGSRTIMRNFDWKNEESLMRSTLKVHPDNAKARNYLAQELIKRKDFEGAKKELDEAVRLDDQLPENYTALGSYYAGIGQPEEAVKNFSKLLEANPQNWQIYQNIANMYYDLGDFAKAAEYTLKTIEINPHPALYTNLGVLYTQAGETDKAKEAFTQALKLDPTNNFAQQSLNQLNNPVSPTPTAKPTAAPKR